MRNKKGELTTTQIVMMIVLIVSFIVVLYFILRLNLGSTTNSEVCHNSVELMAKGTKYFGNSLQCKTDYVCITGGGKCPNMNPTVTVNVDASDKTQVMKAIADQLANCWYTFGGFQTYYLGDAFQGQGLCAVCDIVGFDNKIPSVSYKDFFDYLQNTQKSNSQTYLQYLYGFSSVQDFIKIPREAQLYASGTIGPNSQFSIITGRGKSGLWDIWPSELVGGQKEFILPPVFLENSDVSGFLNGDCTTFITQAS